jgi:diacylglycerol kinase family enzyme
MAESSAVATVLVAPDVAGRADDVRRALERHALLHELRVLDRVEDAGGAARLSIAEGRRFVVAVGGDDLVHEVVNGMIEGDAPPAEPPLLGVLAAGIDNEFLRQFGLPMDIDAASNHLAGDQVYAIDIGRATYTSSDGTERRCCFANIAQVGLGAEMAARAGRSLGGVDRRRLFLAFWRSLLRSRRAEVHVEAARQVYDGRAREVVIGNGRYGPGGFRVSPRSFPGDGVFEVLVHHGPRSQAFTTLPAAIQGEQLPSPHITEMRGNRVRVTSDPALAVAVDGRAVGRTPASFEVLPRAVLLKV